MRRHILGWAALAGILAPALTLAAGPSLEQTLSGVAEKIGLEGRKGPSLFQPGIGVGEYSGWIKAAQKKTNIAGVASSGRASASLEVSRPGMAPITGECGGGQGRIGLGWIDFKRSDLSFVCSYGGGAPQGAEFDLAESKGGGFGALVQPQRAAELHYGEIRLRARTQYIGGIPLAGAQGGAFSYVITRPDGAPVGGLQTNGLRPTFWLPKQRGPERDAAALMAITLFAFRDPGRNN